MKQEPKSQIAVVGPKQILGLRNDCLQQIGDVPALDPFLHDLPLLFGGSFDPRFPARVATCWEALILPRQTVRF